MVVTALLALVVIWKSWKWPLWAAAALIVPFLLIDTIFLTANMLKVFHGGWVPLLIGGFVIVIMLTWRRGAKILAAKTRRLETPIEVLIKSLEKSPPPRVPGTAVFLTATPDSAPTALLAQPQALQGAAHQQRHPHHHHRERAAGRRQGPRADRAARRQLHARGAALRLHGSAERAEGARHCAETRLDLRHHVHVVLPVATLGARPTRARGMPLWQDRLFIFLAQNADDASSYFQLPTDRVVEIGTQVTV